MSKHVDIVCVGSDFKPGDVQPDGYMEFFDWAEVQHKAGLRQVRRACGLWHFPQETCEHEEN